MSEKAIDWTKPIMRRDGTKLRLLCTDLKENPNPVIVAVNETGREHVNAYPPSGRWSGSSDFDIINVPEKVKRWVNVYPYATNTGFLCGGTMFETEGRAKREAMSNVVATVPIEFEI